MLNFADKTLSCATPFQLDKEQWVDQPIERVFAFFAEPGNLQTITPPWMSFRLVSCSTPAIEQGTILEYALRVRGLPMKWISQISVWEPPFRFVDEQLHGPYRRWRHEHTFEDHGQRTRIGDHVDYAVPGGRWVEKWLVRRDLEKIFAYRIESLGRAFRAMDSGR